jgi:hypothetical protein
LPPSDFWALPPSELLALLSDLLLPPSALLALLSDLLLLSELLALLEVSLLLFATLLLLLFASLFPFVALALLSAAAFGAAFLRGVVALARGFLGGSVGGTAATSGLLSLIRNSRGWEVNETIHAKREFRGATLVFGRPAIRNVKTLTSLEGNHRGQKALFVEQNGNGNGGR